VGLVYRHFRNPDTPALMALWNAALTTRGCALIPKPNLLEAQFLAKPWFDPRGVLVAEDDQSAEGSNLVGAAVAGFGAHATPFRIDPQQGILSLVMVHPQFRRQKIGTGLLRRAEGYLREKGTTQIQAGSDVLHTPYFWGLLGSSSPVGVLASDTGAGDFLKARGYQAAQPFAVLTRPAEKPVAMGDPRFPALRRRFALNYHPRRPTTWLEEATQGSLEAVIFELVETASDQPVAGVRAWDMTIFGGKGQPPKAGLYGLSVQPAWRGQGIAKYLLCLLLQHLQEQMYAQIEAALPQELAATWKLFEQLAFISADAGWTYSKRIS
jgi:ribosomal protein S18 acetylase RimI-like enzyme